MNKTAPKVSVIIPVYNVEKYLGKCLDSVLAQTFQDLEIICVNDGSPDKCGDILSEYAQKDQRIKVISQENKGLSGARNAGIKSAEGDYIMFLDSDDMLPKYAVETLYSIATKLKVPVVASCKKTAEEIDRTQINYKIIDNNPFLKFVLNKNIHSSSCNKIYRQDIIKNRHFIEGIYFEDWPFITEVFADIPVYVTTEVPCYIYRENNVSMTRSPFDRRKADSYLTGIRSVYDYFKNRKDLRIAQKRISVAMKMLINKTFKSKEPALQQYVAAECAQLLKNKVVYRFDLPIKALFRLWRMK